LQLTGVTTAASGRGDDDDVVCTACLAARSSRRLQHRVERAARFKFAENLGEVRRLRVDA